MRDIVKFCAKNRKSEVIRDILAIFDKRDLTSVYTHDSQHDLEEMDNGRE